MADSVGALPGPLWASILQACTALTRQTLWLWQLCQPPSLRLSGPADPIHCLNRPPGAQLLGKAPQSKDGPAELSRHGISIRGSIGHSVGAAAAICHAHPGDRGWKKDGAPGTAAISGAKAPRGPRKWRVQSTQRMLGWSCQG